MILRAPPSAVPRALPRSPPRDPSDIPGLRLWLEADYGVDLSGADVATWRDRSGNGRHAVQGPAGNLPLFTTSGGRPCLRFDAANTESLQIAHDAGLRSGTNGTIYAVVKSSQAGTSKAVCGKWGGDDGVVVSATHDDFILMVNGTGSADIAQAYISEVGTSAARAASSGNASDGTSHTLVWRWSGASIFASLDGTTSAGTACAGAKTTGTAPMRIGRYGASLSPVVGWWDGDLFALIEAPYQAAGSALDVAIRNYLRQKWGTP